MAQCLRESYMVVSGWQHCRERLRARCQICTSSCQQICSAQQVCAPARTRPKQCLQRCDQRAATELKRVHTCAVTLRRLQHHTNVQPEPPNSSTKQNDLPNSLPGLQFAELRSGFRSRVHDSYSRSSDRVGRAIAFGRAMSLLVLIWRGTIAVRRCRSRNARRRRVAVAGGMDGFAEHAAQRHAPASSPARWQRVWYVGGGGV
jgi:hypothetical protein